jgi:hypothetical protein
MRAIATRVRGPFIYHPDLTAVTVPSTTITDAISPIWCRFRVNQQQYLARKNAYGYYNDIVHFVETLQPTVYVRCSASDLNTNVQILETLIEEVETILWSAMEILQLGLSNGLMQLLKMD